MDPEVEALYGLPLDEFTKARDALARARAKEQGKEAGAAVKALRKPSVIAWALNQLARKQPEEVAVLLEVGARLRRAQTATLEGGDPDELREATKAENREVGALASQAASILRSAGRGGSAAHEERLAATLRAAAVDPEAGDLLSRGVLSAELSPAGFGFGVGDEQLPTDFRALKPNSRASTHGSQREERDERERAHKEKARAERQRQRDLEQELRAAKETAARLEREADKAEERARNARQAADDAAARVKALENDPQE